MKTLNALLIILESWGFWVLVSVGCLFLWQQNVAQEDAPVVAVQQEESPFFPAEGIFIGIFLVSLNDEWHPARLVLEPTTDAIWVYTMDLKNPNRVLIIQRKMPEQEPETIWADPEAYHEGASIRSFFF
jgi:hypothetical protein